MEKLMRWEFEELRGRLPGGAISLRAKSLEEAMTKLKKRWDINLTSTEDPNVFKDLKTGMRYRMTCKESESRPLTWRKKLVRR
jgi:hypothetical protein